MIIDFSNLIFVISGLIVAGSFLTAALFGFDLKEIRSRDLDLKILMWVPFAAVFLFSLKSGSGFRSMFFAAIILSIVIEFFRMLRLKRAGHFSRVLIFSYIILFLAAFSHTGFLRFLPNASAYYVSLIIGTAVSDVGGFFFGSLFKRHPLPNWINPKKSWEGVFGQLAGAFVGILLVNLFVLKGGSLLVFIPIGLGAAAGDLLNSAAKRMLGVKNWSNALPGHGGFIDRFSSLAGSGLFLFYFLAVLRA